MAEENMALKYSSTLIPLLTADTLWFRYPLNMSYFDTCSITAAFLDFKEKLQFVVYYVIMPAYFFIGVIGNITLLFAFWKQNEKNKAYAYQIYFTVSKTLEILFSSIFWWGYKWHAGVERPGNLWYMNNYTLMFISAHIGCPLSNGFIMISLLLSVAMTADRVFALGKPYAYKSINQKKHQLVASLICALIGLGTSGFEVNRWHVLSGYNKSNSVYIVEYNQEYLSRPPVIALGHFRTAVRLVSLALLIILNIIMLIIFRKRTLKVHQMTAANAIKDKARKAAEKTLLVITVCQSCLTAFSHIPHSIYFVAAFMSAKFDLCYGGALAPIADACICLGDAADIFVIIGTDGKMRRAVFRLITCCKGQMPPMTTMPAPAPSMVTRAASMKRGSTRSVVTLHK